MRLDIGVVGGMLLINDAYNANPMSMSAALEILAIAQDAAGRSRDAVATAAEALRLARTRGARALASRLKRRLSSFESRAGLQPR